MKCLASLVDKLIWLWSGLQTVLAYELKALSISAEETGIPKIFDANKDKTGNLRVIPGGCNQSTAKIDYFTLCHHKTEIPKMLDFLSFFHFVHLISTLGFSFTYDPNPISCPSIHPS